MNLKSTVNNLLWGLFKWVVITHSKRISQKMGMGWALSYLFHVRLELSSFKEAIFDKYGFFKSFKYAFDFKLQDKEIDRYFNIPDTKFRLPTDKQIVLEDRKYLHFDGVSMGYDYAKVDDDGCLRYKGKPTYYWFDFVDGILYFQSVYKIGTLEDVSEELRYPWTLVHILPH